MDMDEDEKEMLSEARARLANTKCAVTFSARFFGDQATALLVTWETTLSLS